MPAASIMNTGNFNSQPHKEADVTKSKFYPAIAYFNSQPHKEADTTERTEKPSRIISTHSLTRRLTIRIHQISIILLHFNSQPHKEADLRAHLLSDWGQDISTHSLTRRLTASQLSDCCCTTHFNSQPHKEADTHKRKVP